MDGGLLPLMSKKRARASGRIRKRRYGRENTRCMVPMSMTSDDPGSSEFDFAFQVTALIKKAKSLLSFLM